MDIQTIESKYKQLDDISHVLLRAEIYAGSRKRLDLSKYLLHADGKIYAEQISIVPAAITFANELICNSFDEFVRTHTNNDKPWQVDDIDVVVDLQRKSLTVRDNGGIPVAIDATTNMLIPSMIFGHLRTGSNYTDDRGSVGGMNGLGAKLLNVFAKHFHLRTADGVHQLQQSWHDNMHHTDEPVITSATEHFTEVIAEFDTDASKCGIDASAYDITWARCVEARCAEIAAMSTTYNAKLRIRFTCIPESGELWHSCFEFSRFEDYLKLWPNSDKFIIDKNYRFNVALGLSDGACESLGIVNAMECNWGTHIDAFLDACAFHVRAMIQSRYKIDIRPAKIKSYFKIISTWQVDAATFAGQTKETLVSDIKELGMPVIPSEQFIKKLLRSEVVNTIIDELHNRIAAQRKAEIATQQKEIDRKTKRNILPDKLTDAANAGRDKFARLYVVEGDSAACGLKRFRNAETDGVFAMFGKSMGNALKYDEGGVLANRALSALCQGLGFSFLNSGALRYDQIIIATDADYDGSAIAGLLLTFFNKFMPEIIEQGRLYRLRTPMMTATNAKTGELHQYYSLQEFEQDKHNVKGKDWRIAYIKGLATLTDDDYMQIMKSPYLDQIIKDDFADGSIAAWFGNDSSKRKELMQMSELTDDGFLAFLNEDEIENTEIE